MTTEQIDLYKLRSEDFSRNFHSHREVEWHTTYQVYGGYAAIVLAYSQLHAKYSSSIPFMCVGVLLVLILFTSSFYLSRRLQERLHFTRDMQNEYLKKLHEALKIEELPRPSTTRAPIHGRHYAAAVQTILSATAALTIIVYMLLSPVGDAKRDEPPNNGMHLMEPAQATELRK
jgi:hypothetical protein